MSNFCENSASMTLAGSNPSSVSDTTIDANVRIRTLCGIIPPVVSTPGARPPQGGLCYVRTALVWRTDEKGSDVNLATQLLVDGFDNAYDCAVLVTNDSDLLGPIRVVRHRLGKRVGLLNPQQRPARALQGEAHLYKQIRSGVLAASQFPLTLTDANGTFTKPATW